MVAINFGGLAEWLGGRLQICLMPVRIRYLLRSVVSSQVVYEGESLHLEFLELEMDEATFYWDMV